MKQCRMCSQRLTRPGRLCRECERELDRARRAGVAIGEVAPALLSLDASRVAGDGGLHWPRSPGTVIGAAFAIGLASAIALHAVQSSQAATAADSVMLDPHPAMRVKAEEHARARYCNAGAGQLPRCATPVRDHGQ